MSVEISHTRPLVRLRACVCARALGASFVTTSTRSSGQRGSKIYVWNIIYIYFIVFFTVFRR